MLLWYWQEKREVLLLLGERFGGKIKRKPGCGGAKTWDTLTFVNSTEHSAAVSQGCPIGTCKVGTLCIGEPLNSSMTA